VDVVPLNYRGLARLETLSLSGNRLTELPEQASAGPPPADVSCSSGGASPRPPPPPVQIGELKALAVLNVADNAITSSCPRASRASP